MARLVTRKRRDLGWEHGYDVALIDQTRPEIRGPNGVPMPHVSDKTLMLDLVQLLLAGRWLRHTWGSRAARSRCVIIPELPSAAAAAA